MFAGKIIEDLNLKGYQVGGAKISEKHANFIINTGNATASDIKQIIDLVKTKVKEKYNLSCFIKLDNSEIKVVAVSKKHDTTLANNIMRLVQEEFKQKKNITVKFEK